MTILGVMAPYLMGTYPGALVTALHAHARQAGAALLLVHTGSQTSSYELDLGIARADAWVVILNCASPELLRRIHASGRPVCIIAHDYEIASFGLVRTDNRAGILAALRHLYDKGHRRFAYIGPANIADCRERRDAVLEFARLHAADCPPPCLQEADDFSYAGGRVAMQALLATQATQATFSALIAGTDNNALGAIAGLRDRGLRVPEDVAVVGFDNSVYARLSGISTLAQDFDSLAALAFDDVWQRRGDAGAAARKLRAAPQLILRESTGDRDEQAPPEMIDRRLAQSFFAVSEEVVQLSRGGRDEYLREYLKRMEHRLRLASIARIDDARRTAVIVSVVPEQGPRAMAGLPGAQAPLAAWPPTPEGFEFAAGDFIAMLWQGDIAKGAEVVTLCFAAQELDSAYVLETLVHEIELLRYQLHVHRMGDDLRHTLDSLRATQSELLRTEKLAALGTAVSGVAHEMNTPLGNCLLTVSTLAGVAASVQRKHDEGALRRADLEQLLSTSAAAAQLLERNIGVALRLVGDFKGLRVEHGANPPQAVSLTALLGELLAFVRPRAREQGVDIVLELAAGAQDDRFDTRPELLTQVLGELVQNALIHGLADREAGGEIRIRAMIDEQGVAISVADNGIGIAPDAADKVFDPFYTTRMGAASGLGLTMAQNLVTGPLKGELRLDQSRRGGACFRIHLPLRLPARSAGPGGG